MIFVNRKRSTHTHDRSKTGAGSLRSARRKRRRAATSPALHRRANNPVLHPAMAGAMSDHKLFLDVTLVIAGLALLAMIATAFGGAGPVAKWLDKGRK